MNALIDACDASEAKEHPISRSEKLHFALTHIHPFADSNGRTARLLGILELIRSGFMPILLEPEDRRTQNILQRIRTLQHVRGAGKRRSY
jgi:Fic family protein